MTAARDDATAGEQVSQQSRRAGLLVHQTIGESRYGFSSFNSARRTLRGYEAMHMIRKGQIQRVVKGDIEAQVNFVGRIFGMAA